MTIGKASKELSADLSQGRKSTSIGLPQFHTRLWLNTSDGVNDSDTKKSWAYLCANRSFISTLALYGIEIQGKKETVTKSDETILYFRKLLTDQDLREMGLYTRPSPPPLSMSELHDLGI